MEITKYKNLVFEGGGVKGSAYAGAVQVLHENNLLKHVEHVAGTSAGSMTATLLAVGGGSEGLTESIVKTNFNQFIYDPGWVFMDIYRLLCHYGIHSGNKFVQILKSHIKKYSGDPNLTFEGLEEKIKNEPHKFKKLSIIASNITTKKTHVFNVENTPKVPIWKAVRCSMSIPIIFEPYKVDNDYYVDGGIGWNYPIDIFDTKNADGSITRNPNTLGFYLEPHNENSSFAPEKTKINSVKSAAEAMLDFLFYNANSKHIHQEDKKRTVFIDDLGISGTDFSISKKNVERLIESGRKATEQFLAL